MKKGLMPFENCPVGKLIWNFHSQDLTVWNDLGTKWPTFHVSKKIELWSFVVICADLTAQVTSFTHVIQGCERSLMWPVVIGPDDGRFYRDDQTCQPLGTQTCILKCQKLYFPLKKRIFKSHPKHRLHDRARDQNIASSSQHFDFEQSRRGKKKRKKKRRKQTKVKRKKS